MMMSMYVCLSLCFGYVLSRSDFNFNEGNILVNTSLYIALATCQTFKRERERERERAESIWWRCRVNCLVLFLFILLIFVNKFFIPHINELFGCIATCIPILIVLVQKNTVTGLARKISLCELPRYDRPSWGSLSIDGGGGASQQFHRSPVGLSFGLH